jgi:hypothetical protein
MKPPNLTKKSTFLRASYRIAEAASDELFSGWFAMWSMNSFSEFAHLVG